MRQYRKYSDYDVAKHAANVKSMRQLFLAIGIKPAGGNYVSMKRLLQKLDIDCSHWTGQAWNKGQRLKDWSQYTKASALKAHLIIERGHRCERCKKEKWFNKPIPLEIHHIDGDRTNNDEGNLKLYCCNCHALTEGWRGKKDKVIASKICKECGSKISDSNRSGHCHSCSMKQSVKRNRRVQPTGKSFQYICIECGCAISGNGKHQLCVACAHKKNRKVITRPDHDIIKSMVSKQGYCATGRHFGVSDSAVRKWLKAS